MKLTEYLLQGKRVNKKAKLKIAIKLSNGERRKKGAVITIVKDNEDGTFHAEDNDWACKVTKDEFEYVN